ncbi:hypothetical protein OF83DRAFT_1089571 [Amylostereum chailletii]|nr:hypothetical protein OF83DRAFT_1089571 [Amylostereum chailletii]
MDLITLKDRIHSQVSTVDSPSLHGDGLDPNRWWKTQASVGMLAQKLWAPSYPPVATISSAPMHPLPSPLPSPSPIPPTPGPTALPPTRPPPCPCPIKLTMAIISSPPLPVPSSSNVAKPAPKFWHPKIRAPRPAVTQELAKCHFNAKASTLVTQGHYKDP